MIIFLHWCTINDLVEMFTTFISKQSLAGFHLNGPVKFLPRTSLRPSSFRRKGNEKKYGRRIKQKESWNVLLKGMLELKKTRPNQLVWG